MSASVGYGRLGWNVGAWNTSPDAAAIITGQLIQSSELNFGEGWGRESWNEGAWNSPIGLVLTGTGVIFSTTGQQATTSLNDVIVTAATSSKFYYWSTSNYVNLADVTTTAATTNPITGQQATGTIGTYSIAAGGTMTIVVPEFDNKY